MTHIAVLPKFTTTRTVMTTASNNVQSIPTCSTDQHGFGVYQLTTADASDATIRTLVPVLSAPSHIVNPSLLIPFPPTPWTYRITVRLSQPFDYHC